MSLMIALRTSAVACGVALVSACGGDVGGGEDLALNQIRQDYVASINALRSASALTNIDDLITSNRLTPRNGLRTVKGARTINGLCTVKGRRTVSGLSVDCTGATAGVSCTGEPDGLLDSQTGLMRSDAGMMTAKFLMRCALPKQDSIRIKDHTGGVVVLGGELGLAPEWKDGQCDLSCQERVSACLTTFAGGGEPSAELELSRTWPRGPDAHNAPM